MLLSFALMFFSSPGQTFLVSLFGEHLRADLKLSHGEFGLIYSCATLLSALCLLKTGSLIDRFSVQRVTLSITCGLAFACFCMALSHNVALLFFAIFMLRHFGQGLFSITSTTTMMRYLPEYKGRANAFSKMGFSAAEIAMPSLIVCALMFFNWQMVWVLIGLAVVIVMPIVTSVASPALRAKIGDANALNVNEGSQDRSWTMSEVLRDPVFYLLIPALVAQPMLHTGFLFHQIPLVVEKGWPLTSWAVFYSLFAITSVLSLIATGYVVDRIEGSIKLIPFSLLPAAAALTLLSQYHALPTAAFFLLLMGFTSGMQAAISAPFLAERYGTLHYASIRSFVHFLLILMTAVAPILFGYLIDHGTKISEIASYAVVYCVVSIGASAAGVKLIKRGPNSFETK